MPTPAPDSPTPSSSAAATRKSARRKPAPPVVRTTRDYFIMVRERWYWGLLAGLLVAAVLVVLEMRRPPYYSTAAQLLFERPSAAMRIAGATDTGSELSLGADFVRLRSAKFLDYVVASFTPAQIAAIREPYFQPELPLAEQPSAQHVIRPRMVIEEVRAQPIARIWISHRDPATAKLVADQFALSYINYTRDRTAEDASQSLEFLREEERKQRQRVEEANAALQAYREQHNIPMQRESQGLLAQNLQNIGAQYQAAKNSRLEIESTLKQIEAFQESGKYLEQISYISSYRTVPTLQREIDELRAERAQLEQRYLENHPRLRANTLAIEAKTALLNEVISMAVTELRASFDRARQLEDDLLRQYTTEEKKTKELASVLDDYRVLEQQADLTRAHYSEVLASLNKAGLNAPLDSLNISLLEAAPVPSRPDAPDPMKAAIQGSVALVVLLFVVPILLGLLDNRLTAAWEIEQFLDQTLLGEIPVLSGVSRADKAHIMAREVDHTASEAFRGIYGQLQLSSAVPYPKTLMITSTEPGEGKSVVGNNLAATFAAHGKKTLLVDCDFRRPNLHLYYGKDDTAGVLRWLKASGGKPPAKPEDDPDLAILEVKTNLYLLRAGGEHRRATEIFENEAFATLLKALKTQFDLVIIDTPPLGVFPDAMLAANHCDEALYVCRFKTVSRAKIRRTLERLEKSTTQIAGVVLNGLPSGGQSAYYDYYGYGSNQSKHYKAYYSQKRS
ncbi:MAG: polysaccharide biosynthesis tyrosine autokinase [Opitutaceae bacterium]|nr:polysaccharide biosynthesis tyrosine autokinase [Opitutaceae bacterium]